MTASERAEYQALKAEHKSLITLTRNLWYRLRMVEMILINMADNREFASKLHGLRESLYSTGEYHADNPDSYTFEDALADMTLVNLEVASQQEDQV